MVQFRDTNPFSYVLVANGTDIASDVNELVMVNATGERVSYTISWLRLHLQSHFVRHIINMIWHISPKLLLHDRHITTDL